MNYVGILDHGGSRWRIRVPDLPGVEGLSMSVEAAMRIVIGGVQDCLVHYRTNCQPYPAPRSEFDVLCDRDVGFDPMAGEDFVLIPVMIGGFSLRLALCELEAAAI